MALSRGKNKSTGWATHAFVLGFVASEPRPFVRIALKQIIMHKAQYESVCCPTCAALSLHLFIVLRAVRRGRESAAGVVGAVSFRFSSRSVCKAVQK